MKNTKSEKAQLKMVLKSSDQDYTLLFFYPKDSTPGCTREAKAFSSLRTKFRALGVEVMGVSRDSEKSHQRFAEKEALRIPLVSDSDEALCGHFAVIKEKTLYGRKYMGVDRSTFLLETKSGRIVSEWRGVKPDGHAEEILKALPEILKK